MNNNMGLIHYEGLLVCRERGRERTAVITGWMGRDGHVNCHDNLELFKPYFDHSKLLFCFSWGQRLCLSQSEAGPPNTTSMRLILIS